MRHLVVLIPISLIPVPHEQLTWFDKVFYGQLRFLAGNSDNCCVVKVELAKKLGVSDETVERSIIRLSVAGLIFRKRLRNRILIVFLNSPLLEGSNRRPARHESAGQPSSSDVSEPAAMRVAENPEPAVVRSQNPQLRGLHIRKI
jgi:hypothetical protein